MKVIKKEEGNTVIILFKVFHIQMGEQRRQKVIGRSNRNTNWKWREIEKMGILFHLLLWVYLMKKERESIPYCCCTLWNNLVIKESDFISHFFPFGISNLDFFNPGIHKTFPNGSEWSVEHTCLQRQDFLWESLVLCWQTKEMKNKRRKCTWYCSPIRSAIWRPIGLFIFTRVCIKEIPNSKNMIGNINLEQLKQS